jgi:hypothetical protein
MPAFFVAEMTAVSRFTCAHEQAHWLIHQEMFCGSEILLAMLKNISKSSDVDKNIERQADMLGQRSSDAYLFRLRKHFNRFFTNQIGLTSAGTIRCLEKAMEIRLKEHHLI